MSRLNVLALTAVAPLLSGCAALHHVTKLNASGGYKVLLVCIGLAVGILLVSIIGVVAEKIEQWAEPAYRRKAVAGRQSNNLLKNCSRKPPEGSRLFWLVLTVRFCLDAVFVIAGATCIIYAWMGLTPRILWLFEEGPALTDYVPPADITIWATLGALAFSLVGSWLHYVVLVYVSPPRVVAMLEDHEITTKAREEEKRRAKEAKSSHVDAKSMIKMTMDVGGYHERGELAGGIDYKEAFDCYMEAARKGHMPAIRKVAEYYMLGRCMDPDPIEALAWIYSMGSEMNSGDRRTMEKLEAILGSQGMRAAQKRSKQIWEARPGPLD